MSGTGGRIGRRRVDRTRSQTMTIPNQNAIDRFEEVVEALNARDFDRFAATHADDVVLHDHDETLRGVEAAVAHERALYESFPDMQYHVETTVAEGNVVAARWTVTGTHEGEFQGLPPTGNQVEIQAMGVMTGEDREITEVRLVYDRLGLMEQLGVLEPPAA